MGGACPEAGHPLPNAPSIAAERDRKVGRHAFLDIGHSAHRPTGTGGGRCAQEFANNQCLGLEGPQSEKSIKNTKHGCL